MSLPPANSDTHYAFDASYKQYKRLKYDYQTKQWIFQDWMPVGWQPRRVRHNRADSGHSQQTAYPSMETATASSANATSASSHISSPQYSTPPLQAIYPSGSLESYNNTPSIAPPGLPITPMPRGQGNYLQGTYHGSNTSHYEEMDKSFCVRPSSFFFEGRVFAVMMNETAGTNATNNITDYNSNKSITAVKYNDNYVYTNVRRFVVVRRRHEFCYACPIFTYSGKATTKRGVRPAAHGIAYSWGKQPELIPSEGGITKAPIAVVMTEKVHTLDPASRIYYGIHHPIQYNVKVKDIGYVTQPEIPVLIGNWRAEDENDTQQPRSITDTAEIPE
ncbi:hypothetical protein GQ44DRAFT_757681 [Phaeosphaeriaceae sp. PMI808]|nr:hypothetical protein GQ44DRAFT_757681 [Phaeosphaeriaceae sp. PMI808]